MYTVADPEGRGFRGLEPPSSKSLLKKLKITHFESSENQNMVEPPSPFKIPGSTPDIFQQL